MVKAKDFIISTMLLFSACKTEVVRPWDRYRKPPVPVELENKSNLLLIIGEETGTVTSVSFPEQVVVTEPCDSINKRYPLGMGETYSAYNITEKPSEYAKIEIKSSVTDRDKKDTIQYNSCHNSYDMLMGRNTKPDTVYIHFYKNGTETKVVKNVMPVAATNTDAQRGILGLNRSSITTTGQPTFSEFTTDLVKTAENLKVVKFSY
jgi:hypothetical protein